MFDDDPELCKMVQAIIAECQMSYELTDEYFLQVRMRSD